MVPRTRLPEILARIYEIGAKYKLRLSNVFHAGDGNLHPNINYDGRDAEEVERVMAASREIMKLCVDAGGRSPESMGVGADKIAYMPMIFDQASLDAMLAVRGCSTRQDCAIREGDSCGEDVPRIPPGFRFRLSHLRITRARRRSGQGQALPHKVAEYDIEFNEACGDCRGRACPPPGVWPGNLKNVQLQWQAAACGTITEVQVMSRRVALLSLVFAFSIALGQTPQPNFHRLKHHCHRR